MQTSVQRRRKLIGVSPFVREFRHGPTCRQLTPGVRSLHTRAVHTRVIPVMMHNEEERDGSEDDDDDEQRHDRPQAAVAVRVSSSSDWQGSVMLILVLEGPILVNVTGEMLITEMTSVVGADKRKCRCTVHLVGFLFCRNSACPRVSCRHLITLGPPLFFGPSLPVCVCVCVCRQTVT